MVCDRCIMVVKQILANAGLSFRQIQLGQVELVEEPEPGQLDALRNGLAEHGFELLDDKKSRIVEQIKTSIISQIHGPEMNEFNLKMSSLLSKKLGMDYHYLSTLFSSVEGVTIEKYVILQRIEKVKELLRYDEKSLGDIAWELGYSSVQHLSQQFKKITGLTPSAFKKLRENNRKPLDKVRGGG